MTLKMDESLKGGGVWKTGGLQQSDVMDEGKVCDCVK